MFFHASHPSLSPHDLAPRMPRLAASGDAPGRMIHLPELPVVRGVAANIGARLELTCALVQQVCVWGGGG